MTYTTKKKNKNRRELKSILKTKLFYFYDIARKKIWVAYNWNALTNRD
jgi:hypothetical protein